MNSRIYIIGGLGSGKSFLSKKLSEKSGLEYFEMDKIVFKESKFEERTEQERNVIFENILKKDNWILEGTFTEEWIVPGLSRATKIIYLSTLPSLRLFRFMKRIIKQGIHKQNNLLNRIKLVLGFKHKEWNRTAEKYKQLLEPFKSKVITLRSKKEVNDFMSM